MNSLVILILGHETFQLGDLRGISPSFVTFLHEGNVAPIIKFITRSRIYYQKIFPSFLLLLYELGFSPVQTLTREASSLIIAVHEWHQLQLPGLHLAPWNQSFDASCEACPVTIIASIMNGHDQKHWLQSNYYYYYYYYLWYEWKDIISMIEGNLMGKFNYGTRIRMDGFHYNYFIKNNFIFIRSSNIIEIF